jgi:hypothetical protein
MINNLKFKMKRFLWECLLIMGIFSTNHLKAIDLMHWNENKVRSINTSIWRLLSTKCGKVSNPEKKHNCEIQILKWKTQSKMNNKENKKQVQIISADSNGLFKVSHNEFGTQKIRKKTSGIQGSKTQIRNSGGINKFHGYRIK